MSIFEMVETILIGPIKFVFEFIFAVAYRFIGHPGLAIIALSLAMNILVLPLYKRADAMQEEARDIEAKLHKGIVHIRKTFSGDERMMILQTYYRQNHYSPLSVLNGSVSLLLEIPFFMAAYQFLSHLEILNGVSLGPIADLGAPDGLIVLGGLTVNLLPILMTLVNVISSAIYLKGFPLKTKIQLYAMALFFLVFLYSSPSCLVFYWTLNNVFSLIKTIFYKIKNPRRKLKILGLIAGILLFGFVIFIYDAAPRRRIFVAGIALILILPAVLGRMNLPRRKVVSGQSNRRQFVMCGLLLTALVGLLIPSNFIAASPQEYVDIYYFHHPLWYVANALCLAAGGFLVWMNVFYWLADSRIRVLLEKGIWMLCGIMLVNYLFFGTDLGIISHMLQYENVMRFSFGEQAMNLVVLLLVAAALYIFLLKKTKVVGAILMTAILALTGMSGMNINSICQSIDELYATISNEQDSRPGFRLSQNGRNVIVLMLDRAMGEYIPYLFNEKPELQKQFSGFTYYPNTISFSRATNMAAPPLMGGYEYTPVEMNKRKDESLASKHNEALKVMPVLFSENGFETTVCDPPYANYQYTPDLSIFDEYPQITSYITEGRFSDAGHKEKVVSDNMRNFFWFSLMKTMPVMLQPTLYNEGQYNQMKEKTDEVVYSKQTTFGMSRASGLSELFMNAYNVLTSLPYMTEIVEDDRDTFLCLVNNATHEPVILQMPEYVPAMEIDNTAYDAMHGDRFAMDGKALTMESALQISHYQTNMAVMIQLGKWFDYLRDNGVYDNTRIILVADHGRHLYHTQELILSEKGEEFDLECYYPLLMVKDFNSQVFATSDEFMTNADVPVLATDGLIESPRNPFTGELISKQEKYAHEQFVSMSGDYDIMKNNGNVFSPSTWLSVKDNIWEKDNWTYYEQEVALDKHAAP